ncbi:MAG TPA: translocation/assembly module TamB domain-containing protein [Gammaproteobacteria bacterium]|nr:translocation/assembly module TamB domain-containing protein [Gammaproteobacteria bacterium]
MRRRTILFVSIAVVAAALGALAGAAAWLVGTEEGSARAVALAAGQVPETISYGRVEGTLARGLVLHDVELRLGADVVRMDRLALSLRLSDLLAGRVGLDDVEVSKAVYVRGPSEPAEPHAIATPIPLVVGSARVGSLTIEVGDTVLVFDDTAAEGRWIGKDVVLEHVETTSEGFTASGHGRLVLAEAIELDADFDWAGDLAGRRFAGGANVSGTLPELEVGSRLTAPFPGGVTGRIEATGEPRFDLDFDWTSFEWPGLPVPVPASPMGTLAVSGTWSAYDFEARSSLAYEGEQGQLAISGKGAGTALALDRFELDTAHGTVRGAGNVEIAAREWDLAVESDDLDSARLFPDWPGRGRASGRFSGRLAPGLEWRFANLEAEGVLREHPLRALGSVSYAASSGYRLDGVRVESGRDVLAVSGSIGGRDGGGGGGAGSSGSVRGDRLDLDVSVDVAQLGDFLPAALDAGGNVTASFKIGGSIDDPRLEGEATAIDARLRGYRVGRLTLESKLGVDRGSPLEIRLRASDVLEGPMRLDAVDVDAAGTLLAHRVTATARGAAFTARAAAAGAFGGGVWRGRVDELVLSPARLGAWKLEEPADLRVGAQQAVLSSSCLAQGASRVCATLDVAGTVDDSLHVTAENFDLAVLAPFLPAGVSLRGVYGLDASLTALGGAPSGSLELEGGKTRIEIGGRPDEGFATEIDSVSVGARLDRGRLTVRSDVSGRETGNLRLEAVVDDVREAKSPVHGELHGEWPDLAFLAMLSPSVGRVGGSLSANLDFGGSLDAPAVKGEADWKDGSVSVPDWGFLVEHVEGRASSADGSALEYRASGRVGDGELSLTGVTKLDPEGGVSTSLTLRGDALRVVQLPEAEIYASPELAARVKLPDIYVDGTVTVPRANITLETLPAQAVAPSADTVLHGSAEEPEQPHPLHLHSNIKIVLGDDVKYAGINLATTLKGQMQLAYDTGRSATAAGRLNVAGSYTAYGQSLKLDRGELLFNGPIGNPALDVRAVRTIESTTVGIELTGTLQMPETRLFSTPAMSEADALSYLLFGRPLRGTGGAEETATLQTAAISMGLQQALPVVQRIGQTLGLDELTVGSTETDAGALMAGKYLSPKVYIRYSYGLFNRIGGLLLRFKVNDRLSLETRSGDEKSMDLLYTVEKK